MFVAMIVHKTTDNVVAVFECPLETDYDDVIKAFLKLNGMTEATKHNYKVNGAHVITFGGWSKYIS